MMTPSEKCWHKDESRSRKLHLPKCRTSVAGRQQSRAWVDRGSMTLISASLCAALMLISVALIGASSMLIASRTADRAADLAALAAALTIQEQGTSAAGQSSDPCQVAQKIADANQATLIACEQRDEDIIVTTTVKPAVIPQRSGKLGEQTAVARAGPA